MFAFELKRDRAEAVSMIGRTALQKYNINKINEAGGFAVVMYPENFTQAMKEFDEFCKIID
jgi:hypothetical protein